MPVPERPTIDTPKIEAQDLLEGVRASNPEACNRVRTALSQAARKFRWGVPSKNIEEESDQELSERAAPNKGRKSKQHSTGNSWLGLTVMLNVIAWEHGFRDWKAYKGAIAFICSLDSYGSDGWSGGDWNSTEMYHPVTVLTDYSGPIGGGYTTIFRWMVHDLIDTRDFKIEHLGMPLKGATEAERYAIQNYVRDGRSGDHYTAYSTIAMLSIAIDESSTWEAIQFVIDGNWDRDRRPHYSSMNRTVRRYCASLKLQRMVNCLVIPSAWPERAAKLGYPTDNEKQKEIERAMEQVKEYASATEKPN